MIKNLEMQHILFQKKVQIKDLVDQKINIKMIILIDIKVKSNYRLYQIIIMLNKIKINIIINSSTGKKVNKINPKTLLK